VRQRHERHDIAIAHGGSVLSRKVDDQIDEYRRYYVALVACVGLSRALAMPGFGKNVGARKVASTLGRRHGSSLIQRPIKQVQHANATDQFT